MAPEAGELGLKNTYWLLRHGRSLANEAGIIISQKENGLKPDWALASQGREQAETAGKQLKQQLDAAAYTAPVADGTPSVDVEKVHVYCSPFSRTVMTAKIAAAEAGLTDDSKIQTTDYLIERCFGSEAEGKPDMDTYEKLWKQDATSLDSKLGNDGESLNDVSARVRALFKELEEKHKDSHLLLVSHGDTLSILQATMEGADVRQHRRFAFNTAELRRLGSGPAHTS